MNDSLYDHLDVNKTTRCQGSNRPLRFSGVEAFLLGYPIFRTKHLKVRVFLVDHGIDDMTSAVSICAIDGDMLAVHWID